VVVQRAGKAAVDTVADLVDRAGAGAVDRGFAGTAVAVVEVGSIVGEPVK
jgi:hypothetical protein